MRHGEALAHEMKNVFLQAQAGIAIVDGAQPACRVPDVPQGRAKRLGRELHRDQSRLRTIAARAAAYGVESRGRLGLEYGAVEFPRVDSPISQTAVLLRKPRGHS